MPDITGTPGTGAVGTPTHGRTIPLSGWFGRGKFSALTGISVAASVGSVIGAAGNTIWAESASRADVLAAINSATYDDTVIVPAGTYTWGAKVPVTKGIRIIANGIGNTNITNGGFTFTPDTGQRSGDYMFRVSGFTFAGTNSEPIALEGTETLGWPPMTKIRIDHNRFTSSGTYPIGVSGDFWGVIDNNQFAGNQAFTVMGGNQPAWDNYYSSRFVCGTADNLYFEDNVFSGSGDWYINVGHGSRYAFRHNAWTGLNIPSPAFDQHGNQTGSPPICANMLCEIYENTWTGVSNALQFEYQRGGKVMMFNNMVNGSYSGLPSVSCHDDVADVDPVNQIQHPQQTYFWNNMFNGTRKDCSQGATINYGGDIGIVPRENVHFWNHATSFNGTVGVGVGLKSARPASCSAEGVAYWATDESILYRWHNSAWETFYAPYAYPHPLRSL